MFSVCSFSPLVVSVSLVFSAVYLQGIFCMHTIIKLGSVLLTFVHSLINFTTERQKKEIVFGGKKNKVYLEAIEEVLLLLGHLIY